MKQPHVGADIIEIGRFKKAQERWGKRFLNRVFTDAELALCGNHSESLAARFAGKEAVMKALAESGAGFNWREIEILARESGKPYLTLRGAALAKSQALGLAELDISLSHSKDLAIAVVMAISA
jgi:holo-[acyl-carrier protein] synthase